MKSSSLLIRIKQDKDKDDCKARVAVHGIKNKKRHSTQKMLRYLEKSYDKIRKEKTMYEKTRQDRKQDETRQKHKTMQDTTIPKKDKTR